MPAARSAAAALLAAAAPALSQDCGDVTSVSLTASWPAVSGADVYDVEYVASGDPGAPTPAPAATYACFNQTCTPATPGTDLASCRKNCVGPPAPPPPPPAAALYVCWQGKCLADPNGVSKQVCEQNCAPGPVLRGGGVKWPDPPYYTTQTSAGASAIIVDLKPSTRYIFRVRAHQPNADLHLSEGWGSFGSMPTWACTTAAAPAGAPTGLRRSGGLRNSSLRVEWDPPRGAAAAAAAAGGQLVRAWDGGAGHRGGWAAAPLSGAPAATVAAPAGATAAELTGLAPGRVYWVRVGGGDAVPFRTAAAGVRVWENARVSRTDVVDFLSDHDGGDVAADAGFMSVYWHMFTGGGDFDNSVMTLYCVESADVDWGDYLSCGNPLDSACRCRNSQDAKYARGQEGCNVKGYEYSKQYPARQPIYGVTFNIPPSDPQLGWWYSTPSSKTLNQGGKTYECAEGAAVGDGGCTWARHPVASTVTGKWLTQNGFTPGDRGSKASLVNANAKSATATFENFPGPHRCCGC